VDQRGSEEAASVDRRSSEGMSNQRGSEEGTSMGLRGSEEGALMGQRGSGRKCQIRFSGSALHERRTSGVKGTEVMGGPYIKGRCSYGSSLS